MHDPLVVAFEIKRPWPKRTTKFGGMRGWRWPSMVTVWHREPGGADALSVCKHHSWWRLHVHHWRIQVPPLQHLRRRLLTRCAWCGGRSRKGDMVDVSHTWDGQRAPWWRGERGLFHSDCSSIETAHRTCVCEDPLTTQATDYGRCALCGGFRPYGAEPERLARVRELKAIPVGGRRPADPATLED